jgi:MOSC domain-containing protein YiiM
MTTHGFSDLPRDTHVMRQLVAHSEGNLGVYATILQSGTVTAKDSVHVQGSGDGRE